MSFDPDNLPIEKIAAFCKRHGIQRLSLFGSAVRDDYSPDSDLDVLVEFVPDARTGLRFFTMQDELSAIFGQPVDLNTPGFLSRYFREEALAEAKVVYDAA